ncbi:2-hydroxyacylsphingosine 1-beta-galactosyltransferase-like [Agrilus planipennis]|uniref:UDP-glucuronosyltransferase n=1 Tax=Agrilus planipennis TaxID=224129 RepID=A0A1W4WWJ0_AGRPL|nr:2-hydroxyacylsphingosine 1-beta-galactosyltransferase-like [Agrilus planipennis]
MMLCGLSACLFAIIGYVTSAKILAVIHAPTFSHYSLGVKLLRPLAEKGHHVTLVTHFSLENPPKTWNEIILKDFTKGIAFGNKFDFLSMSNYKREMFANGIGVDLTERVLNHPAFVDLLNSNETFDLIILERFMNDALIGLSHRFKAPYIYLSPIGYSRWVSDLTGNPGSPAYYPDFFLGYSYDMTLWQRFYNTLFYCFALVHRHMVVLPRHKELLKMHFPEAPSFEDLYYNSSLILMNTHFSIKYSVPSVPNMIDIGGYHVSPPRDLPNDLKKYMDSATDGVIYFSLGSGAKSKDMPTETRDAMLRVFSNLKQKVLWKWEEDVTFQKPSNVKMEKWFPQQDVLAHPNLKLFITHGGLLSTIEAIYHAVPLLALPVFGDQLMNAAEIEALGYGLKLPFVDFDKQQFKLLINEILTNNRYKKGIKTRSDILHDQETKPVDRAVWWIEYVIRHKGAPHLKSVTLNLKWYQYILLDVLALAVVIIFLIVTSVYVCLKKLFKENKKSKKD